MTSNANASPYSVDLSSRANADFKAISSKSDFAKVDKILSLLETTPKMGRVYDPAYEATRLPFKLFVVYAGHYGVYYELDHNACQVKILFIEDQRRDPLMRFR